MQKIGKPYNKIMLGFITGAFFLLLFLGLPNETNAVALPTVNIATHDIEVDAIVITDGDTVTPVINSTKQIFLKGRINGISGPGTTAVTAYAQRSGIGTGSCTADPLNCYPSENGVSMGDCTLVVINPAIQDYTCEFNIQFFADTTTALTEPGTDYTSEFWRIYVEATHGAAIVSDDTSTFEYDSLLGFGFPLTFGLGSFNPSSGTPTAETTTNITNLGNVRFDVQYLTPNDFSCTGPAVVDKSALRFSGVSGTYASKNPLTTTYTVLTGFDLVKKSTVATPSAKDVFWQFLTSDPLPPGSCSLDGIDMLGIVG